MHTFVHLRVLHKYQNAAIVHIGFYMSIQTI